MTTGDLNDVFRSLGALEAEVKTAAENRQQTRHEIKNLAQKVEIMMTQVSELTAAIKDMKPHVSSWAQIRQRMIGALLAAGALGGIGGSALADVIRGILQ